MHSSAYKRCHSTFLYPRWTRPLKLCIMLTIFVCLYRPSDFNGLRVLVVGTGNTAADVVTTLKAHAKQVYWSHRRGALIVRSHYPTDPRKQETADNVLST